MATYFTTANIVLSNLLTIANPPQAALGVLSFAATGGLIAVAGIIYLTLFGRQIVPARQPGPEQELARRPSAELEGLYEVSERLWEARGEELSSLAGSQPSKMRLWRKIWDCRRCHATRFASLLYSSSRRDYSARFSFDCWP